MGHGAAAMKLFRKIRLWLALRGLKSSDKTRRLAALEALGGSPDDAAIAALVGHLGAQDDDLQRTAVEQLRRIGTQDVVHALLGKLRGGGVYFHGRHAISELLARIGGDEAIGALI